MFAVFYICRSWNLIFNCKTRHKTCRPQIRANVIEVVRVSRDVRCHPRLWRWNGGWLLLQTNIPRPRFAQIILCALQKFRNSSAVVVFPFSSQVLKTVDSSDVTPSVIKCKTAVQFSLSVCNRSNIFLSLQSSTVRFRSLLGCGTTSPALNPWPSALAAGARSPTSSLNASCRCFNF